MPPICGASYRTPCLMRALIPDSALFTASLVQSNSQPVLYWVLPRPGGGVKPRIAASALANRRSSGLGLALSDRFGADDQHPLRPRVFQRAPRGGLRALDRIPRLRTQSQCESTPVPRALVADRRVDPSLELPLGLSRHRQRRQVEISLSIDFHPSLQGRHLAVAGVEQSSLTEQFSDPLDLGKVQRIVGSIARMNVAGYEQTGRFRGRGHEFQSVPRPRP